MYTYIPSKLTYLLKKKIATPKRKMSESSNYQLLSVDEQLPFSQPTKGQVSPPCENDVVLSSWFQCENFCKFWRVAII